MYRLLRRSPPLVLFVLTALAPACVGGGARERVGAPGRAASAPEITPLRRLTRLEYDNTVRDLLGDQQRLGEGFSADALGPAGFTTGGLVSGVEAVQYMEAAERIADAAVARLDLLLPCRPAAAGEDACAARFVETFGRRAFRRPLAADERRRFQDLYARAKREGEPFPERIRQVVAAFLQAPAFLYRSERAPRAPFERAARLSYALWASMPDDPLLDAAESGRLETEEDLDREARRLLRDGRARDGLGQFLIDWLRLEEGGDILKDGRRFKMWSDGLRASMREETRRFFTHVVLEGDGRLETLLTARFTFADERLAKLYGAEVPPGGGFARVTLPADSGRSGLLTHALLLAKNASPVATSPTRRGKLVREQLLCQTLPPPPPDVDMTPPKPMAGASIRDQMSEHALKLACAECHDLIDPIGFALERFDAIGREQTTDGDQPIDDSGTLEETDVDGPVAGAAALGARLAGSEMVRRCVARQMFRFLRGRPETAGERSLERAYRDFAASGFNLRELVVALAREEVAP